MMGEGITRNMYSSLQEIKAVLTVKVKGRFLGLSSALQPLVG
jgi:hypothetical protein